MTLIRTAGIEASQTRSDLCSTRAKRSPVMTRASQAGFSLVEVLCATLILGIGLFGLAQGITTALSANKESELQTVAALYAAGQIEMLRADGFLSVGTDQGECGPRLPIYRWTRQVTETEIDGLFEVTVAVFHNRTEKLIFELQTLLFDPPYDSGLDTTEDTTGNGTGARVRRGAR